MSKATLFHLLSLCFFIPMLIVMCQCTSPLSLMLDGYFFMGINWMFEWNNIVLVCTMITWAGIGHHFNQQEG